MRDVGSNLQKFEDRLLAHNKLGTSARDPKHVDKIKVKLSYFFNLKNGDKTSALI